MGEGSNERPFRYRDNRREEVEPADSSSLSSSFSFPLLS